MYTLLYTAQNCVTLEISKSKYERFCAVSVAVTFCVFDDKDHNFTVSFVIRFINGSTARTEPLLTLSPPSLWLSQ